MTDLHPWTDVLAYASLQLPEPWRELFVNDMVTILDVYTLADVQDLEVLSRYLLNVWRLTFAARYAEANRAISHSLRMGEVHALLGDEHLDADAYEILVWSGMPHGDLTLFAAEDCDCGH